MAALTYTLGMLGQSSSNAVSLLIRLTDDQEIGLRYFAVWALGQIGVPGAEPAISRRLRDDDWRIRDQADTALKTIAFRQGAFGRNNSTTLSKSP